MLYSSLTYPVLNEQAKTKTVVVPLGAIEQHGPHLPVSTDTDIVTNIALAAEQQLYDLIIVCPTLATGSSHHHLSFGGTMSLAPDLYTQVICDIAKSLLSGGFKKIVFLNGHGGNIMPVKQALAIISHKYDEILAPNIALVTYWELAAKYFTANEVMQSPALSHACEYETSLMLHLYSEKVKMEKVRRSQRPKRNSYVPWEDDEPYRGITMIKQTAFVSNNGNSGEPQLATVEKGKYLFDHAVKELVAFLESFDKWPYLKNIQHDKN